MGDGERMVLLIEDDEDTRDVTTAFLELAGLRVRCAATGAEAIAVANEDPPDAIVMDLTLPDASGAEVRSKLLAEERTRSVPVLALTGRELREIDRALFPDVMRKPADLESVVAWVKRRSLPSPEVAAPLRR
jgi:two-component system, OmpR family, response regulator